MKRSDYERFKATVEAADQQPIQSPFSSLLTAHPDLHAVKNYLVKQANSSQHEPDIQQKVKSWLETEIDPEVIETRKQIPPEYLAGLRKTGCLSAKIPEQYNGKGLSQIQFSRLLELIASRSEVLALVVSVQQLGVIQALLSQQKLENAQNQEQSQHLRQRYLKQLAKNAVGAFCLTTPETGSDPSRLMTLAHISKNGQTVVISGNRQQGGKLYTSLGTIADVYLMLAVVLYPGETIDQVEPRKRITAFIIDRNTKGISTQALNFCGWHGLPNAAIELNQVTIPIQQQLGQVGEGLKIAFMNLGTGRINISAIALGMMKPLCHVSCWWGNKRIQGGKAIGLHELNTEQLLKMNANIYASESYLNYCSALADDPKADIRLEAAMLKLFSSQVLNDIADQTMQIRGGRGYESYASQTSRGETAIAVERLYRSARMLKIGEGGSNILQLYIMRCLLDSIIQQFKNFNADIPSSQNSFLYLLKLTKQGWQAFRQQNGTNYHFSYPLFKQRNKQLRQQQARLKRYLARQLILEYKDNVLKSVIGNNKASRSIKSLANQLEQRQVMIGHCAQIASLIAIAQTGLIQAELKPSSQSKVLAECFSQQALDEIQIQFMQLARHNRYQSRKLMFLGQQILNDNFADTIKNNVLLKELN